MSSLRTAVLCLALAVSLFPSKTFAQDQSAKPRFVQVASPSPILRGSASALINADATQAPFNAPRDGKSDCTAALQNAIDNVARDGGGVVFLPAGRYLFRGSLVLREGVTLRGEYSGTARTGGTILMPVGGRGEENATPFITMERGTGVRNLSIWYPEQKPEAIVPYPWAIAASAQKTGDNYTVMDVTLVNPYLGMRFGPDWNELHTVRNVRGTPLKTGFFTDTCTDIGRLLKVHFAPSVWEESGLQNFSLSTQKALRNYLKANATGIEMGRSDWEYSDGVTVEGYARGLHIHQGKEGTSNAVFHNFRATGGTIGAQIDEVNPIGLSFTQSAFSGSESGVLMGEKLKNSVLFHGTDLGGGQSALRSLGTGRIGLQKSRIHAPLHLEGGSLAALDNIFSAPPTGAAVRLGAKVHRALLERNSIGNRVLSARDVQSTAVDADIQIIEEAAPKNITPDFPPRNLRIFGLHAIKSQAPQLFVITDFGASPDAPDNTAAIQRALDAAGKVGGTVYIPPKNYRCAGSLRVPAGATLRGSFDVPHHTISGGSTLMPTGGRGDENARPFLEMEAGSTVTGFTVWYPEQSATAFAPYPWAIRTLGPNCFLENITLANAWQGVDMSTHNSDNSRVDYLAGAPLRRGLSVSKGRDVLIENVQFNPHYWARKHPSYPEPAPDANAAWSQYIKAQQSLLEAFIIGRAENLTMRDNFVYSARHGLRFVEDGGGASGTIINHGSDAATVGVTLDAASTTKPLTFFNTEIAAFNLEKNTLREAALLVGDNFAGDARFYGSMSWAGEKEPTAIIGGKGRVLISGWNSMDGPIIARGGHLTLENMRIRHAENEELKIENAAQVTARVNEGKRGSAFRIVPTDAPQLVQRANARALPEIALRRTFFTDFEGGAAPLTETLDGGNVKNIAERFARVLGGAGTKSGKGFVIAGENKSAENGYIYYKIFDADIPVTPQTVLRYSMRPETAMGRNTGVDLVFSDGSTLRDSGALDSDDLAMHPGRAKGVVGVWTRLESRIGRWNAGKRIKAILIAYDAGKADGAFRAAFDDIEIGEMP